MVSIIDISPGNSMFQFIDELWFADPHANNRAIHRLCTLMRKIGVMTAVKEPMAEDDPMVSNEVAELRAYFGDGLQFRIYRITFIANDVGSDEELVAKKDDLEFLSSSIIINITPDKQRWHSYIFTSLVTIPKKIHECEKKFNLLNNYIGVKKAYKAQIKVSDEQSIEFEIDGTFFCQQNSYTSVCAHATLCMSINNSHLYEEDNLLLPHTINQTLGIDHKEKKLNGGLPVPSIFKFLDEFGFSYEHKYFFAGEPESNFAEHLYRYIESKSSSMLLFTTDNTISHIVPIVGHTLNTDLWRPEAELAYSTRIGETNYRSASAWVDHFIIHDDNFGMYYCLPTDSFDPMPPEMELPQEEPGIDGTPRDNSFKAQLAISLIRKGIITKGSVAEWVSITLLEAAVNANHSEEVKSLFWMKQLRDSLVKSRLNPVVARTYLIDKDAYVKCFPEPSDERQIIIDELPSTFWLSEISVPDLYTANKTQIAEVAIRCDMAIATNEDINNSWIYIRLPGIIALKSKEETAEFLKTSEITSHIPIIRFIPSPSLNEW